MRRFIASILLAATSFVFVAPSLAADSPLLTELQARQARVTGYVGWLDDSTLTGRNFSWLWPSRGENLVVEEMKGWYSFTQYLRENGRSGIPTNAYVLEAEERSPDPTNDYYLTSGPDPDVLVYDIYQTLDYWQSYCHSFVAAAKEYNAIIGEAAAMAGTPNLPEAAVTVIKGVGEKAERLAIDAVTSPQLLPHPCMVFYADLLYVMEEAGTTLTDTDLQIANNFFECVVNWMVQPGRDPFNSTGDRCLVRPMAKLSWGKPPNCSSCIDSTIVIDRTSTGSKYYGRLLHYTTKPGTVGRPGSGDLYYNGKDLMSLAVKGHAQAAKDLRDELAKAGVAVNKAKEDAANLAAELQARGTALSLPLPLSDVKVEGVIGRILNALLGIVGAIALLMFVWGGVTWMTSAGSQEKVAKAQKTLMWAAIGLIAIFSSYAVLNLVIETFSK